MASVAPRPRQRPQGRHPGLLRSVNVTVQAGELRFTRPNQAVVATPEGTARYYEFTDVVIATGSRPAPLPGLVPDGRQILDSTGLLDLTEIPKRLVVVGGGYIGLELGTAFAKLGAHVTIVEAASHLLPTMDAALVRPVLARLRQLDITVLTETLAEDFDGAALRVPSRAASSTSRRTSFSSLSAAFPTPTSSASTSWG